MTESNNLGWFTTDDLAVMSSDDAAALVDDLFASPSDIPSNLIRYRLTSDFQRPWKIEVGRWLAAARNDGYLQKFTRERLVRAFKDSRQDDPAASSTPDPNDPNDPNDPAHKILLEEVAPLMAVYYLTRTGWEFADWEPTVKEGDVDFVLKTPAGDSVNFQVKVSDQPGRIDGGRLFEGEFDKRVIIGLDKAHRQLADASLSGPGIIVLSANRRAHLSRDPRCLLSKVYEKTSCDDHSTWLSAKDYGRFFSDDWTCVSCILLLDFLSGESTQWYGCTVLINPHADFSLRPEWFPRSRILSIERDIFRWRGQEPSWSGIPDGTTVVSR